MQREWTHARQVLGYDRRENPDKLKPLNDLYTHDCSFLANGFCPTPTLGGKT